MADYVNKDYDNKSDIFFFFYLRRVRHDSFFLFINFGEDEIPWTNGNSRSSVTIPDHGYKNKAMA